MIDFTQLGINSLQKPINPRDIFMGLSKKAEQYQYPRDVQGEVWKQWFEQRNNKDTIIKMNTGSGKTIVALMILQSCLNEEFGPALYVVPDNYLVEQVINQAKEMGIKVVDDEDDLDYRRKRAILVINIQKLINGKSVFGLRRNNNYSIGSVVIDDMHACISSIQEQFSVEIPRTEKLYMDIVKLFFECMNVQAEGRFEEIIGERNTFDNMLVPFWKWQENVTNIYRLLSENQDANFLKFKFNLVKDSLKLSRCYISAKGINIIPICTPIHKVKGFDDAKRRIYLSATLPDDSPFATVMGIDFEKEAKVITPEKANDIGERLIIVPKIINKDILDNEMRDAIIEKSKEFNVVVLVPSFMMAEYWKQKGGDVLFAQNISRGIENIKSNNHGLYVFVNKYDGIDLPNNTCRILVIDGLPVISNMNDRYEQEVVRRSERIQREQVQRIEQGMGRGVRSNSDYCLVFLIGNQLTNMLYADDGYNYFSNATKAQFKLSEQMCEQIEGASVERIMQIGAYLLDRNLQWVELCKGMTSRLEYSNQVKISESAILERHAFDYAMIGDYVKAKEEINKLVNLTSDIRMKGYYKQNLAEYINFIDKSEAQQVLKSAKKDNREVLNPIEGIQYEKIKGSIPEQSRSIIEYIKINNFSVNQFIIRIDAILSDLVFESQTSKKFENAVKEIFNAIGFYASQPERECGKGPDNFVILGEGKYLVIECKNETITDTISKHDCNQLNGSYNWFKNQYKDDYLSCTPIMIHNSCVFERACSPNSIIRIMTPEMLNKLKKSIHDFAVALAQEDNFKSVDRINRLIRVYKIGSDSIVKAYTKSFTLSHGK